nr:MAG TPA: GIY-YIG nuclease superfamily protein [Bacteriophage sp.]
MKDDRKWTVYIHTNKVNQKKYVGITSTSVIERWHHGHGYLTKKKDGSFC